MTFYICVNSTNALSREAMVISGSVFASIFFVLASISVYLCYYNRYRAFVLLPVTGFILTYVAAAWAGISSVYGETIDARTQVAVIESMYVISTVVIPISIVQLFELTALAHRRRSVNFCCCIKFEEDANGSAHDTLQKVRIGVWLYGTFLFIAACLTAIIGLSKGPSGYSEYDDLGICLSGAFGPFFYHTEDNEIQYGINEGWDVFLDILQHFSLIGMAIYYGVLLWRYGTHYSFNVYSTYINPWILLLVFALVMFASMFAPAWTYLVMASYALFMLACIMLGFLVAKEIHSQNEFADFLRKQDQSGFVDEIENLFTANSGNSNGNSNGLEGQGEPNNNEPELHVASESVPVKLVDVDMDSMNDQVPVTSKSMPVTSKSMPPFQVKRGDVTDDDDDDQIQVAIT